MNWNSARLLLWTLLPYALLGFFPGREHRAVLLLQYHMLISKVWKVKRCQFSQNGFKFCCQQSLTGNFGITRLGKNPPKRLCQFCSCRITTLWFVGRWKSVDFFLCTVYIKHSLSLKRSLVRPRISTVLEHSYYLTVLHVNLKIWSINLISIDLHGKFKITMTSCPTSSVQNCQ